MSGIAQKKEAESRLVNYFLCKLRSRIYWGDQSVKIDGCLLRAAPLRSNVFGVANYRLMDFCRAYQYSSSKMA